MPHLYPLFVIITSRSYNFTNDFVTVPFIIDVFDRRNIATATVFYGKCGLCKSKLIMSKKNLMANG